MKKRYFAYLIILLGLFCRYACAESICGFTQTDSRHSEMLSVDSRLYVHEKTGAQVLFVENNDTNRVLEIGFAIPADTNSETVSAAASAMAGKNADLIAAQPYVDCFGTYTTDLTLSFRAASGDEEQLLALSALALENCFRKVTDDAVLPFAEEYIHPSDSLTVICGRIDAPEEFLRLLDESFSKFERREISWERPAPVTEIRETFVEYPAAEGTDEAHATIAVLGYVCSGADYETMQKINLLSDVLNLPHSEFRRQFTARFPDAAVSCAITCAAADTVLQFTAVGIGKEDAEDFRKLVNESLAALVANGFDRDSTEADIAAQLLNESLKLGKPESDWQLTGDILYFHAATGKPYALFDYRDDMALYAQYAFDGTFAGLLAQYAGENAVTEFTVASPKIEASQASADSTASTPSAEAPFQSETVSAEMPRLPICSIATLPEEMRLYDISDTSEENGIRRIDVTADAGTAGAAVVLLCADEVPQDQLLYLHLFADLIFRMPTKTRDAAALAQMRSRYLFGATCEATALGDPFVPYLSFSFYELNDDLSSAYALVSEMLTETDFSDLDALSEALTAVITESSAFYDSDSFVIPQLLYADCGSAGAEAGIGYMNGPAYFTFLTGLASADPAEVASVLSDIQTKLTNADSAVLGYVGTADGQAANRAASAEFLSALPCAERTPCAYALDPLPNSEAFAVSAQAATNLIHASYDAMDTTETEGELRAVSALITEQLLQPLLLAEGEKTAVFQIVDNHGISIVTSADSYIYDTYYMFMQLPEAVSLLGEAIDSAAVEASVMRTYRAFTAHNGELEDGVRVLRNLLHGQTQEGTLGILPGMKKVSAERFPEYAALYQKIMDVCRVSTTAPILMIYEDEDIFEQVTMPFGEKELPEITFTDIGEDSEIYDAAWFCAFYGLMQPREDGRFAPEEALTVGEYARGVYGLLADAADTDEAIAFLSENGILESTDADSVMDRAAFARCTFALLTYYGIALDESVPEGYPDADAADGQFGALVEYGAILPVDGMLLPDASATRGDLAWMLLWMCS